MTALGEPRKSIEREIVIKDLDSGTYSVVYEDPDGALHRVGEVTVENPKR